MIRSVLIFSVCVLFLTTSPSYAVSYSALLLTKYRVNASGKSLLIFSPYGSDGNFVRLTLTSSLRATLWAYYAEDGKPYQSTSIVIELVNGGWVKLTASGLLNGVAYLAPNDGSSWGGAFLQPDPNSTNLKNGLVFATSNCFSFIDPVLFLPGLAGASTSSGGSDGGSTLPQVVNPSVSGPGFSADSKKVELPVQNLLTFKQQTGEYWDFFSLTTRTLPVSLGGMESYTPAYDWEGVKHSFYTSGGTTSNDDTPADWYRVNVKDIFDPVIIGFATLAAFMMPYNEFRKGAK